MTLDALISDLGWILPTLPARLRLVALEAGVFKGHAVRCLAGQVGIVAGDASHLALLKAFALPKGNDLVGHAIAFTSSRMDGAVVVLKSVARSEA
jgi:hypothetical protein